MPAHEAEEVVLFNCHCRESFQTHHVAHDAVLDEIVNDHELAVNRKVAVVIFARALPGGLSAQSRVVCRCDDA